MDYFVARGKIQLLGILFCSLDITLQSAIEMRVHFILFMIW